MIDLGNGYTLTAVDEINLVLNNTHMTKATESKPSVETTSVVGYYPRKWLPVALNAAYDCMVRDEVSKDELISLETLMTRMDVLYKQFAETMLEYKTLIVPLEPKKPRKRKNTNTQEDGQALT